MSKGTLEEEVSLVAPLLWLGKGVPESAEGWQP